MKTETIAQVKKFKLEFEKFDDWVYIKCVGRWEDGPFLLPRKFFDEQETKRAKSKTPYNWILNVAHKHIYSALSKDYLKRYFETGLWQPDNWKTWIIDPLPLLKEGIKRRYYQANISNGFLYFNNKPVRRPFSLELHRYHSKQELIKRLLKNPKVLKAELQDVPYYNQDTWNELQCIHIIYMPSTREFNKLVPDIGRALWEIEQGLNIKKFKKEDD